MVTVAADAGAGRASIVAVSALVSAVAVNRLMREGRWDLKRDFRTVPFARRMGRAASTAPARLGERAVRHRRCKVARFPPGN
ncbi:hypothetical protein GCM10018966_077570 [Streptomyces yanii]